MTTSLTFSRQTSHSVLFTVGEFEGINLLSLALNYRTTQYLTLPSHLELYNIIILHPFDVYPSVCVRCVCKITIRCYLILGNVTLGNGDGT